MARYVSVLDANTLECISTQFTDTQPRIIKTYEDKIIQVMDKNIEIWSSSGKLINTINNECYEIIVKDGLLLTRSDSIICVYNLTNLLLVVKLVIPKLYEFAYSYGKIVTISFKNGLSIYDLNRRLLNNYKNYKPDVWIINEYLLAFSTNENTILVHDLRVDKLRCVFIGHADTITDIVIPEHYLISTSKDLTIKIWSVALSDHLKTINVQSVIWKVIPYNNGFITYDTAKQIKQWVVAFDYHKRPNFRALTSNSYNLLHTTNNNHNVELFENKLVAYSKREIYIFDLKTNQYVILDSVENDIISLKIEHETLIINDGDLHFMNLINFELITIPKIDSFVISELRC